MDSVFVSAQEVWIGAVLRDIIPTKDKNLFKYTLSLNFSVSICEPNIQHRSPPFVKGDLGGFNIRFSVEENHSCFL